MSKSLSSKHLANDKKTNIHKDIYVQTHSEL